MGHTHVINYQVGWKSSYWLWHIEIAKDGNYFFMSIATILSQCKDLGQRICSGIAASVHDTY